MWNSNLWSANLHLSVCFLHKTWLLARLQACLRTLSLSLSWVDFSPKEYSGSGWNENEVLLDFGIWTLVNSLIYDLHLLVFILEEVLELQKCTLSFASSFWICVCAGRRLYPARKKVILLPVLFCTTILRVSIPFQEKLGINQAFLLCQIIWSII